MKVIIAGGTGFLGSALVRSLERDGHQPTLLTRTPRQRNHLAWAPNTSIFTSAITEADVVVNLAGESIAGGRWSEARKSAIRGSRVTATRSLAEAVRAVRGSPPVFISGSAIGIYGTRDDAPVTEETPPGSDFLASVCREWEGEALAAAGRTRVVLLRTGLVLDRKGGALPQMARPFWFMAGGPLGSGRQAMSWVHVDDWVNMVRWSMDHAAVVGALNVTAPNPVTNAEMAATLGAVLHRPAALPAPAPALRLLLGEMADALLLGGQRVLPARATSLGFQFRYPALEPALREIYSR